MESAVLLPYTYGKILSRNSLSCGSSQISMASHTRVRCCASSELGEMVGTAVGALGGAAGSEVLPNLTPLAALQDTVRWQGTAAAAALTAVVCAQACFVRFGVLLAAVVKSTLFWETRKILGDAHFVTEQAGDRSLSLCDHCSGTQGLCPMAALLPGEKH